jgi:MYXO-CTERM domain-containing protein
MHLSTLFRACAVASLATVAFTACGDGATGPESVATSSAASTSISGCDYSFARPSPSSLVSMGYKFVCRYLSGDPGGGKDLTASEQSSLEAAGIDIVLNWETSGTDAENGYDAGVSDATAAKAEAESLGQPSDRPIYFSIDFDAESSDAPAINEYFQGVASVLGLARTGVYGGYYIVNELFGAGLVTWAWQTYAWSNGAWDSRAQLRQVQNGVDNDELDADTAVAADYGQYGPGSPVSGDGGGGYYAATYVSQSWPLASSTWTLTACQTVASSITLKNTGTLPWNSQTRIGTTQPRDRTSVFADSTWLSVNRAAAVTGTVAPGDTFEFKFDFHAPPTAGAYTEYFGVVQDGVAWFSDPGQGGPPDDDIEANIQVTGTGSCDVDPGVPDGSAGAGVDAGTKREDGGTTSPGHDAGTAANDAGLEVPDAGSSDTDAGATDSTTSGSKGCSVTATPRGPGAWVLMGGALLLALRRRRASCGLRLVRLPPAVRRSGSAPPRPSP